MRTCETATSLSSSEVKGEMNVGASIETNDLLSSLENGNQHRRNTWLQAFEW